MTLEYKKTNHDYYCCDTRWNARNGEGFAEFDCWEDFKAEWGLKDKTFYDCYNYLFDHWTPEQGGHRYKATRNLAKPMKDEAKEVKRQYTEDKPPAAPKGYKLVEAEHTPYGLYYFKYVKEPPKRATSRMRI